jgi:hypothetical protein
MLSFGARCVNMEEVGNIRLGAKPTGVHETTSKRVAKQFKVPALTTQAKLKTTLPISGYRRTFDGLDLFVFFHG